MADKGGFDQVPANTKGKFTPFQIQIPDETLQDMQTLLRLSPIAKATYESLRPERALGLNWSWLGAAVEEWQESFDWKKHEKHANTFPQFNADIRDGEHNYDIHFVALFSQKPDAIPILLLHGWPGSFLEFLPMLSILRDRYTSETLPYHLVVPSLPGYTFSSQPPLDKDFQIEDAARIFNTLATSLGFQQYIVQGGDVGSKVARALGKYPSVAAVHLNFCLMPEPVESIPHDKFNDLDLTGLHRAREFNRIGNAYALEHATKPATIGIVLQSSPIALLAWIGEKFLDWTDDDPSIDAILESVTLYWVTGCIATSLWPYRQLFTPGTEEKPTFKNHAEPSWRLRRFGYSFFPKEIVPVPKAWAEKTGNLVWYRQHERGGHFAAVERTEVLLKDLEDFVGEVWQT